jgi:aromatic-ring opening dioxygenase LigAB LigA subunit
MANKLARFLLHLARNNEALESFKKDPNKIMEKAGLSNVEKDAILKKDISKINQLGFPGSRRRGQADIDIMITIKGTHDWINVYEEDQAD